eukprot:scaffold7227_cov160-Amphora_coffeaeformis.AAC.4
MSPPSCKDEHLLTTKFCVLVRNEQPQHLDGIKFTKIGTRNEKPAEWDTMAKDKLGMRKQLRYPLTKPICQMAETETLHHWYCHREGAKAETNSLRSCVSLQHGLCKDRTLENKFAGPRGRRTTRELCLLQKCK